MIQDQSKTCETNLVDTLAVLLAAISVSFRLIRVFSIAFARFFRSLNILIFLFCFLLAFLPY